MHLTNETYLFPVLRFRLRYLPQLLLLEDVSLLTCQQMWILHDGVPVHFILAVREWEGRYYPGRGSVVVPRLLVSWPPRSPDLNPIGFTCGVP
jgi:hypothetical protein